uniref:Uncharacterized protein n=1 Tax=Ciona savignyi TaxID=51511 RepID=H2ZBT2_CIOSA
MSDWKLRHLKARPSGTAFLHNTSKANRQCSHPHSKLPCQRQHYSGIEGYRCSRFQGSCP